MSPETRTALEASIEHWKDLESRTVPPQALEITARHCPLCALFLQSEVRREKCTGCPVKESVEGYERQECENTPWHDVWHSLVSWGAFPQNEVHAEAFRTQARRMREFLESLREQG